MKFLKICPRVILSFIILVILKCMSQKKSNFLINCIVMNSHQIFNCSHFKVFVHFQAATVLLWCFYKSVTAEVTHFQGDSWKRLQKVSVFDNPGHTTELNKNWQNFSGKIWWGWLCLFVSNIASSFMLGFFFFFWPDLRKLPFSLKLLDIC